MFVRQQMIIEDVANYTMYIKYLCGTGPVKGRNNSSIRLFVFFLINAA